MNILIKQVCTSVIVLISFLHSTFMKIGEIIPLTKMLQASSKFNFIFFDDLHLQIIESISPKASVENSSAQ